jgi:hypothetical protein
MGKPFFRLVSLNFSPNMPDFDCKICLTSRKNDNSPRSKPSTATSLIFIFQQTPYILLLNGTFVRLFFGRALINPSPSSFTRFLMVLTATPCVSVIGLDILNA